MPWVGISYTGSDTAMGQQGFTRQELRDIFDLDVDRPEDRPTIAALQASSSRHETAPSTPARALRRLFRKLRAPERHKSAVRTADC